MECIIKRKHNIYIDCGACFNNGRLGCLRLDDLKEFYVWREWFEMWFLVSIGFIGLILVLGLIVSAVFLNLPDILNEYDETIDELRKRKERRNKIKEKKEK